MGSQQHYLEKEFHLLTQGENELSGFVENHCLDGIWYWDLNNPEHEWMNAKFWETLGYDPAKQPHLAEAWMDIINPDDLKEAQSNAAKHFEDPDHPYDQIVRYTHREGHTVWIRCRGVAIRDKKGAPIRMLGVHTDVTQLFEQDHQLKVKREEFAQMQSLNQLVLDYTDSGIMCFEAVYDTAGSICDFKWIVVNKAALKMVGRNYSDLMGKNMLDVLPGNKEAGLFDSYKKVVETGEDFTTEIFYPHDNMVEWFRIHAVRSKSDAFSVTFTPITMLKKQQEELEFLNRGLKDFAYAAAHDLQAPLRQCAMFVELFRDELTQNDIKLPEDADSWLDELVSSFSRMRTMVKSLYSLANLESDSIAFEPMQLSEAVEAAKSALSLDILKSEANITYSNLPVLMGANSLMVLLLQNLIANAIKYAGDKAPIVRIESEYLKNQKMHVIRIEDEGLGIPENDAKKIFEPFKRGGLVQEIDGVGMGLTICQRIVQLHKGKLYLDSGYTKGACFVLELPSIE
ncbi:ATP-binding protein [Hirschia litorea]|uniref:histidine kinase n=1 Tax=Hirschia litorea TaxID=1199156 RepID=A0ABW2IKD7_9PROT